MEQKKAEAFQEHILEMERKHQEDREHMKTEHQIVMEEMKSMMEANHLKQIKLLEISKNQPANKVKYVWPDLEISMPGPVDIEAFDNFK